MSKRRFDLPPLDRLEAFEAAARTLSFTRAAAELSITQSAVSRAIASLEDRLGFALFERRHRALLLTERGQTLHRATTEMLERLEATLARMRGRGAGRGLTVTTTLSFASLWLIPRLTRFTRAHPQVDVRIAASNEIVDLDRSGIELAIRYATAERAAGGVMLFAEEVIPVCSPGLVRDRARPMTRPEDLERQVLLHYDDAGHDVPWLLWEPWLESAGVRDLKPAGALHFSHYDQLIQAAVNGQGVALGRIPLLREHLRGKLLVAPFRRSVASPRGYYLMRSARSSNNAEADALVAWLRAEAAISASPPAPSGRTRRSAASK